jgi:tetratricopeptide (TPR) repeat protein
MNLPRAAAALLAASLLALPAGAAQDPAPAGPSDADRALEAGRYGDAQKMFRLAAEAGGAGAGTAFAGLARVLRETGKTADALAAARKAVEAGPPGTDLLVLVGELQASAGDLEGAEKTLREAVAGSESSAVARTALGDLLRATGRRKEAVEAFVAANDIWAAGGADDPRELTAVVRARFSAFELDREFKPTLASTFDLLAEPLKRGLPEAILLEADAYTRHDETGRVANALKPLLLKNPLHPEALVVNARARIRRFESDEAADLARKALTVNPSHAGAIEILALLRYGDGDRRGAEELVRRGLEAHPKDRALLSLDAVRCYLAGDMEGFEAAVRRALAVDPLYGRAFDLCARVLEDHRRFAEAAAMARRAVETDPRDPDGWFSLARNLLDLGNEKEAKEAIAKAEKADAWNNVFRNNFASVLEELDGYSSGSTEHFQLRLHAAEDGALRPLYGKALEDSFRALRARYGYDPEVPVLAEVFRDAGSFSARTLGVPGFGAVGACFGKVVTLDSPGALPPGAFCWRSTVHHELAHVFHLQMTKGRVPRWFTEGLAVHEEEVSNPSWNRNMDRQMVDALANGTVRGLRAIDGTFRSDVMWAYYQAGLMLGWMERDFGWAKVREMLALYGKDLDNEAVVKQALGLSAKEFDDAFLADCRRMTGGWSVRPRWSRERIEGFRKRSEKDPKDLEAHLLLGEACLQLTNAVDAGAALARAQAIAPEDPTLTELRGWLALGSLKNPDRGVELLREALAKGRDHFDLRIELARVAEAKGNIEEAVEHFRKAKMEFPRAQGHDDPRRQLARIYLGLGQKDASVKETEEIVAASETDLEGRLTLAGVYESAGNLDGAVRMLREIVDIMPVPGKPPRGGKPAPGWKPFPAAEVQARLGRDLAQMDRSAEGVDALRLAVVVGRTCDPKENNKTIAKWLVSLAQAAHDAGRVLEAKAALQDAIRTDPNNTEAAEMLRSVGDR